MSLFLLAASLAWLACGDSPAGPDGQDEIGPSGGTVEADGVVLRIPPGSLPTSTPITVVGVPRSRLPASVGPARDSIVPGTLYDFGPDGLTFDPPAVITLGYDPTGLPADTDESRLRVARVDSILTVLPVLARDTAANTITAEVDHFTFFGIVLPDLTLDLTIDVVVEEIIAVTDELPIESTPPVNVVVEEVIAVTDELPIESTPPLDVVVEEIITVTDELPIESTPPLDVVVEEVIAVTDDVPLAGLVPVRIDVIETVGVSDSPGSTVAGPPIANADVSEAITVADAVTVDAPGIVRIDVAEAVGVSDVPTSTPDAQARADVAETVTVTDVPIVTAPGVVRLDVTEAIAVADGVETTVESPPEARAYALSGSGSVLVIDLNTRSVVTSIPIPTGAERIVRRPGTDEIWVSEGSGGGITVVDAATNTVVTSFTSGTGFSSEIVFDASGGTAVVSDLLLGAGPAIVDATTRTLVGLLPDIPGGGRVRGVAISDDGLTGWVSAGDYVGRFDVVARTYGTSSTGVTANEIVLRPGGATLWEYAESDGWMLVRNPVTLVATDTITTPFPRSLTANDGSHVFEEDGSRAWATTEDGRLVALDAASLGTVGDFVLTLPGGRLELDDTLGQAWIIERGGDEVFVVDLSNGSTLARFTLTDPQDIETYR